MKLLDLLTTFHNWLSDKDFIWWPFSFLRPGPKDPITFKLTLLMTACFGGMTLLFFTVFAFLNNELTPSTFVTTFFSCTLGFLIWFNLITRPLWNRRVASIRKGK
jgi:hypothetical protein